MHYSITNQNTRSRHSDVFITYLPKKLNNYVLNILSRNDFFVTYYLPIKLLVTFLNSQATSWGRNYIGIQNVFNFDMKKWRTYSSESSTEAYVAFLSIQGTRWHQNDGPISTSCFFNKTKDNVKCEKSRKNWSLK